MALAATWRERDSNTPALGIHGGGASGGNFIMQALSESLDAFIGAYLRVNDEACR